MKTKSFKKLGALLIALLLLLGILPMAAQPAYAAAPSQTASIGVEYSFDGIHDASLDATITPQILSMVNQSDVVLAPTPTGYSLAIIDHTLPAGAAGLDGKTVKVYYVTDSSQTASISVEYSFDGIHDASLDATITPQILSDVNQSDVVLAPTPTGYSLAMIDHTLPAGAASLDGNTVKVYYVTDPSQTADASLASVAGQTINAGSEAGTSAASKTAAISVGNSVASIADSDIVPTGANAAAALYSDPGFTASAASVSLSVGSGNHLYIKVTAEDGTTTLYYDVTVTRAGAPSYTDASISPKTTSFDKYAPADVSTTLTPGSYTLVKITCDGTDLTADNQYSVSGGVYTFSKTWFATLVNGAHTITFVMSGGANSTLALTVSDSTPTTVSVTGVTLDKSTASVTVGKTVQLTAAVSPNNATNKGMTWSSSDTAIATVDANGKVTGVKAGTAAITVTTDDGGYTVTCKVTVTAADTPATGDGSNRMLWIILGLGSLLVGVCLQVWRKWKGLRAI